MATHSPSVVWPWAEANQGLLSSFGAGVAALALVISLLVWWAQRGLEKTAKEAVACAERIAAAGRVRRFCFTVDILIDRAIQLLHEDNQALHGRLAESPHTLWDVDDGRTMRTVAIENAMGAVLSSAPQEASLVEPTLDALAVISERGHRRFSMSGAGASQYLTQSLDALAKAQSSLHSFRDIEIAALLKPATSEHRAP